MSKKESPKRVPLVPPLQVPKLTEEEAAQMMSDNAELREMSALAYMNKFLPVMKEHNFKMRDRRTVELVHHAVFELIGGVPTFAAWAAENPGDYYKIYSKLLPAEKVAQANTQIVINTSVGKNELDSLTIDGTSVKGVDDDDE